MEAEVEMLIVDQHAAIRHAYYNQNKSIREIARDLQISRQSVRKALASPAPVPIPKLCLALRLNSAPFTTASPHYCRNARASRASSATPPIASFRSSKARATPAQKRAFAA